MTNKLKLVQEIDRRRVELIFYAAFFVGFSAAKEGRLPDNPDNFLEIKRAIELLSRT